MVAGKFHFLRENAFSCPWILIASWFLTIHWFSIG
jgi:hypothetical protein